MTVSYSTKGLDHLGLVSGMCKDIGVAQFIDAAHPNQSKDKSIMIHQSTYILFNGCYCFLCLIYTKCTICHMAFINMYIVVHGRCWWSAFSVRLYGRPSYPATMKATWRRKPRRNSRPTTCIPGTWIYRSSPRRLINYARSENTRHRAKTSRTAPSPPGDWCKS